MKKRRIAVRMKRRNNKSNIQKRGKNKAENYRGVILMDTAYKNILVELVIEKRLREEAEKLKIFPETQAGFRKKRGYIDNI